MKAKLIWFSHAHHVFAFALVYSFCGGSCCPFQHIQLGRFTGYNMPASLVQCSECASTFYVCAAENGSAKTWCIRAQIAHQTKKCYYYCSSCVGEWNEEDKPKYTLSEIRAHCECKHQPSAQAVAQQAAQINTYAATPTTYAAWTHPASSTWPATSVYSSFNTAAPAPPPPCTSTINIAKRMDSLEDHCRRLERTLQSMATSMDILMAAQAHEIQQSVGRGRTAQRATSSARQDQHHRQDHVDVDANDAAASTAPSAAAITSIDIKPSEAARQDQHHRQDHVEVDANDAAASTAPSAAAITSIDIKPSEAARQDQHHRQDHVEVDANDAAVSTAPSVTTNTIMDNKPSEAASSSPPTGPSSSPSSAPPGLPCQDVRYKPFQ